ncbi:hypothetical protein [Bordetella genomosp. 7]|uniref:Uncharacterized protein n=1 Tax=Bordetella genomosp. 7 TaxID=1416805 RepID=A0A261QZ17_9BORD|nr:hypothetical protein [Bordetella genomosp. 7]OZI18028.1 hypothetical protein CAL19_13195 [Bordetella genomosp. 7]
MPLRLPPVLVRPTTALRCGPLRSIGALCAPALSCAMQAANAARVVALLFRALVSYGLGGAVFIILHRLAHGRAMVAPGRRTVPDGPVGACQGQCASGASGAARPRMGRCSAQVMAAAAAV